MITIRQMRQYLRVFQACDSATDDRQVPTGPMADLYYEIEDDLHLERLRDEIRDMRRSRKPKREIEKAAVRADKFEQAMLDKRRKNRAKQRRGR